MKGICFIEPLHGKTVKKIKVQTRRIAKETNNLSVINGKPTYLSKPRYKVGDVLYLKEPYKKWTRGLSEGRHTSILYKYGEDTPCDKVGLEGSSYYTDWKNKLFMPAFAARHYIKITDVRAERLQDISNEDCIKEGIEICKYDTRYYVNDIWGKSKLDGTWENTRTLYDTPKQAYAALINSIDGKDTWDNNPWVWVYDYELIDRKEVQL